MLGFKPLVSSGRGIALPRLRCRLFPSRRPIVRQLLDVVHQHKQLPLPVDLLAPAQREAIQTLVIAQVTKRRLDCTQPFAVDQPTEQAVDLRLHTHDRRVVAVLRFAEEDDLARRLLPVVAQAMRAQV